jgi:hypothetical protein
MIVVDRDKNRPPKGNKTYCTDYINEDFITHQFSGAWYEQDTLEQSISAPRHAGFRSPSSLIQNVAGQALLQVWSEERGSFTQVDLLDDKDEEVNELIRWIRAFTFIPSMANISKRLQTLFNDAKEEDHFHVGIEVESLRTFYSFLQLHNNLKYPAITLTPDNNIYASWRGEEGRRFSVLYLPNSNVRFVRFVQNSKHPELKIRVSGLTTVDMLMETASPNNELNWIQNERG